VIGSALRYIRDRETYDAGRKVATVTYYHNEQTAVVTFQYDNRDRLIHETRVVNGSTTVYDLWYTYDGLGNRLEKRDEAASPRTKTTYFYDTDPANRDRPSAAP